MKYQAPYGSSDPNASYADRNTPGAVTGSKVPAAAIEHPQRELAALITRAGLTPAADDLTQVLRAVRSQRLNYVTVAGTANALTCALEPAPAALADLLGMPLRLKILTTSTASATLAVGALAATAILRPDGSATRAGDLIAGSIVEVAFDGAAFRALGLPNFGVTGTAASGWTRLPNGMILQHGSIGTSSAGPVTITFPIAFPTACRTVMITDESSPVDATQMSVYGAGNYSTTGFQVIGTRNFSSNTADSARYLALGD